VNEHDLAQLSELLARADRVAPLVDVFYGDTDRMTIGLRHDVDDNHDAWNSALAMARWEHAHGYRSTYYFLPTAGYWGSLMAEGLREIAWLGHEIGYHNNALAEARRTGEDPFALLAESLEELRQWSGEPVISTAAHGDEDCRPGGFVNYQLFTEADSEYVRRTFTSPADLGIVPRSIREFGFEFQGDWLNRPHYLSDSGGSWEKYSTTSTLEAVLSEYPYVRGQLIALVHPDWWPVELFALAKAAA